MEHDFVAYKMAGYKNYEWPKTWNLAERGFKNAYVFIPKVCQAARLGNLEGSTYHEVWNHQIRRPHAKGLLWFLDDSQRDVYFQGTDYQPFMVDVDKDIVTMFGIGHCPVTPKQGDTLYYVDGEDKGWPT